MCYTGKCRYETRSGDCSLIGKTSYAYEDNWPDDALCIICEKESSERGDEE